jgi:hypothetical protein
VSEQREALSYTDERTTDIVKKFCGHVHWWTSVRYIFKALFEDEHPSCRTLMERTAPSFFTDLGRILHEYLLLECAKITDPAMTRGNINFTIDFLIENISWPTDQAFLN